MALLHLYDNITAAEINTVNNIDLNDVNNKHHERKNKELISLTVKSDKLKNSRVYTYTSSGSIM